VVAAQASVDGQFRGRTLAVQLLSEGQTAEAIVERITVTSVDPNPQIRQYGIASLGAHPAGSSQDWTGSSTGAWSGGTSGVDAADGRMPYAAQGNILTGPACVEQSEAGFVLEPTAEGEELCFDLPARLMRALLAGAENGEGDVRCTQRNPPVESDSAMIRIDLPSGEPWILLSVTDTWPLSAVDVLYTEYLVWRGFNPCRDDAGLRSFQGNATARSQARQGGQRHRERAEEMYRSAARGNSSSAVFV
jgi:hypothetical protein